MYVFTCECMFECIWMYVCVCNTHQKKRIIIARRESPNWLATHVRSGTISFTNFVLKNS